MAASQPMGKIVPYSRVYVYTMTSADFLRVIGVGVGVLRSLLPGRGDEVAVVRGGECWASLRIEIPNEESVCGLS